MSKQYPTADFNPKNIFSEAVVQTVLPHEDKGGSIFESSEQGDSQLLQKVQRSRNAYVLDGLFKNTIDRYSDSEAGCRLKGNPKLVKYINGRLNLLSLKINHPWQSVFTQAWCEYWKVGTAAIIKYRGETDNSFRALYKNKPYSLSMLACVKIENLQPVKDQETKKPIWKMSSEQFSTIIGSPPKLMVSKDTILDLNLGKDNLLLDGRDVIILAHKRAPGQRYGIGLGFAALDDISLLRSLESAVMTMLRKTMIPLTHLKVSGMHSTRGVYGGTGVGDINSTILDAKQKIMNMPKDNIYVSGENQEISIHGYESQSMRLNDYLNHYFKRGVTALSANPFEIGFEKGNMGDAEASSELRGLKITTAKAEFLRALEMGIIWEMLFEGGWNPYLNEEDRVRLEFIEVDAGAIRKNRAHMADLVDKNFIDLAEARSFCPELKPLPDEKWLRVSYIDIKLLDKQLAVDHSRLDRQGDIDIAKIDKKGQHDKDLAKMRPSTPSTRKVSKSERQWLESILTYEEKDLSRTLSHIENYLDVDLFDYRDKAKSIFFSLSEDRDAGLLAWLDILEAALS